MRHFMTFVFLAVTSISSSWALTTLNGITVTPTNPKVGDAVTITVKGHLDTANCGIRMEFGSPEHPKEEFVLADRGGQFPLTMTKVYTKAGTYKVQALGRKVGTFIFGCAGDVSTQFTVAPAESATAVPVPSVPQCPQGWVMVSGHKDPGKGFSCAPNKPVSKMDCGPKLRYYEKPGLIGCRK